MRPVFESDATVDIPDISGYFRYSRGRRDMVRTGLWRGRHAQQVGRSLALAQRQRTTDSLLQKCDKVPLAYGPSSNRSTLQRANVNRFPVRREADRALSSQAHQATYDKWA